MEIIIYVGMDVHKETYSVCCYDSRTNVSVNSSKVNKTAVYYYTSHRGVKNATENKGRERRISTAL